MKIKGEYHIPALLQETIDLLKVEPGKKYIDATFGGGGHSEEIVKRGGRLLGIDCDPEAVEFSRQRLEKACSTPYQTAGGIKLVWGNFVEIDKIAQENKFENVDGILFDLGVSSHQLETAERGFSFNIGGELDMRMDSRLTVSAKELINVLNEGELAELFTRFGEEKFARRFAKAICRVRKIKKIETCDELAQVILENSLPRGRPALTRRGRFDRTHPATRIFQALRIAVNDELNNLEVALPKAVRLLNTQGRLVVLSFHSLEDRIVKKIFLEQEKKGILKTINDKPIVPGKKEIEANPRSRSAKLRAAEKI